MINAVVSVRAASPIVYVSFCVWYDRSPGASSLVSSMIRASRTAMKASRDGEEDGLATAAE
jgi:hypothetical protein